MSQPIVRVEHLKKFFPVKAGVFQKTVGYIKAVDDVSLEIGEAETVGLVGESGCGKTTAGRTMLRLLDKTDGKVYFKGVEVFGLKREKLRRLRSKMQIIFQDPYSSLNPRLTVGQIVGEVLKDHRLVPDKEIPERVRETIQLCGLAPNHVKKYPHEFSGGQRQRIGIARALIMRPEFIVADEPVSALDVSIQSQIVNLLGELQEKFGFSYLFISHDLSVVKHISHKVGVMYLGAMVEFAGKKELYKNPLHPYTKALLSAVPVPDPTLKRDRIILKGDLPSPANPPPGCRFHTRCPYRLKICEEAAPEYRAVGNGHFAACHLL